MNIAKNGQKFGRKRVSLWHMTFMLYTVPLALSAAPSDVPLFLTQGVPPVALMAIDNSRSMLWEVVISGSPYGFPEGYDPSSGVADFAVGTYLFPDGRDAGNYLYNIPPMTEYAAARSPSFNKLYFNPSSIYEPWPDFGAHFSNADPSAARWDPVLNCADAAKTNEKTICRNVFDLTESGTTNSAPAPVPLGCISGSGANSYYKGFQFYYVNEANAICADGADCDVWKQSTLAGDTYYSRSKCKTDDVSQGCNPTSIFTKKSPDAGCKFSAVSSNIAMQYYPATFYLPHPQVNEPNEDGFAKIERLGQPGWKFGYKKDKITTVVARQVPTNIDSTVEPRKTMLMEKYEIRSGNFESGENKPGVSYYQEAIQNFANWFQYHRNRLLATRAAIGASMKTLQNINIAIFPISNIGGDGTLATELTLTPSTNASMVNDLMDNTAYRILANNTSNSSLMAVMALGDQFANNPSIFAEDHECQRNAGILFTAGVPDVPEIHLGNGTFAAFGNEDAQSYTSAEDGDIKFAGIPPYKDAYSRTIADIAMNYYAKNLRPDLPHSRVRIKNSCFDKPWKASSLDCQSNPHMNFYAITLALKGKLYNNPPVALEEIYAHPPAWTGPDWNDPGWSAGNKQKNLELLDDLWHATINSRGQMIDAGSPEEIAQRLQDVLMSIQGQLGSASSVTSNTTGLYTETLVFQASFDSANWNGHMKAFSLDPINVYNKQLIWDAADTTINPMGTQAANNRVVFSYNPGMAPCGSSSTVVPGPIPFLWDRLGCSQQQALEKTADGRGDERVAYLRGDTVNQRTKDKDTTHWFRYRMGLFGDIVNSDPVFVGGQDYAYDRLPGPEGASYGSFNQGNQADSRKVMLYVGANAGMLHGMDASIAGGSEKLAYVPLASYENLKDYTDPAYAMNSHRYYVDGSPRVADTYLSDKKWHTLLVGTTGAGGRGVFALDITNPDAFATDPSNNIVKWDIYVEKDVTKADASTIQGFSPTTSDLDDGTAGSAIRYGFRKNLGYTFSQASIVTTNSSGVGKWVAILGNGYDSQQGKAILYILEAETGKVVRSILADDGITDTLNGLSTPLAVDIDRDLDVDFVYAGDLHGNLWKFDLRSTDPLEWSVAYQGKPFFVACAADGTTCPHEDRRPITAKPSVGASRYYDQEGQGYMLYVGSGQYFRETDKVIVDPDNPKIYSFYGLWDDVHLNQDGNYVDSGPIRGRDSLLSQKILSEVLKSEANLRITSEISIDYKDTGSNRRRGWYMNLFLDGTAGKEERVVNQALVLDGRVAFVTLQPDPDLCAYGGTSWLMELDAFSGARVDAKFPNWDISGKDGIPDGIFDAEDLVSAGGDKVSPSGKESTVGMIKTPSLIGAGNSDLKITSGSSGALEITRESKPVTARDRWTWRQLR